MHLWSKSCTTPRSSCDIDLKSSPYTTACCCLWCCCKFMLSKSICIFHITFSQEYHRGAQTGICHWKAELHSLVWKYGVGKWMKGCRHLDGCFVMLTGIGVLGSETFFIGMGTFSFFLGGFGKSRLALCPLFGGTLAGDADWRRNLRGDRDLVLDLDLHISREYIFDKKINLLESGGVEQTELALDLTNGVPMASRCFALLA